MDNETYSFQCPSCSCNLSLDLDGVVSAIEPTELKPTERKGIGGLRVEHNPKDRFFSHGYQDNVPKKPAIQPLGELHRPAPEPIAVDPALMAANEKDVRNRNLRTN